MANITDIALSVSSQPMFNSLEVKPLVLKAHSFLSEGSNLCKVLWKPIPGCLPASSVGEI